MTLRFRVLLASALLLSPLVPSLYSAGRNSLLNTWVASSLERVGQHEAGTSTHSIRLYSARAEYESFQIIIGSRAKGVHNARVSVTRLSDREGHTIPAREIAFFSERYVNVPQSSPDWKGSNRPLGAGWYPDGLIPLPPGATFDIPAGINQPLWVDLFVPSGTPSGEYSGTVVIESSEGRARLALSVKVWNFELPRQPHLLSSFGSSYPFSIATAEELLRNKVMPQFVTACPDDSQNCAGTRDLENRLIRQYGLNTADLHFWSGASYGACEMSAPPNPEFLRKAVTTHQPNLLLYNFTADEVQQCRAIWPRLKLWARSIQDAGVLNLVTVAPSPELYDEGSGRSLVDIYVMLPVAYDRAGAEVGRARALGARMWSYNGLVQDAYSPKWQIDFLPINYRIQPGFLSQVMDLTGLLYWRVDAWPTRNPLSEGISNRDVHAPGQSFPGDGLLVYPGLLPGASGVVPSMRLKQIRDGVEDYDYIEMLKELGHTSRALSLAREVGRDWAHWTQDPRVLLTARQSLGNEIEHAVALSSPRLPGRDKAEPTLAPQRK